MKEKKEKKLSKPIIILLTVSIVFLIIGVLDIKVNAEELSEYTASVYSRCVIYSGTTVEDTYEETYHTYTSSTPIYAYCTSNAISPLESGTAEASCFLISQSKFNNGCVSFTWNNETWYSMNYMTSLGVSDGQKITLEFYVSGCENKRVATCYTWNDFLTALQNDTLEFVIDYDSFEVDDSMPIVTNLYFDKIEYSESNTKTITDYIKFDANHDYKLVIMLCPSIFSAFNSSSFIPDYELYQYDSWVRMATADTGLKEISCELGQFAIPLTNVSGIISSNYKSYYESICYDLNENGEVTFYPTMGYRLAYVDLENNKMGPSTYIIPNSYTNLDDSDSFSYFVLYSDGTHNTEKVMDLKTWERIGDITIEEVKEVIDKVNDTLKDYVVVDNDVDVQEATNWLNTVVNFIKGTPPMIGVVLAFLPRPILYGMYVVVFLGVIASGIAIVKALI